MSGLRELTSQEINNKIGNALSNLHAPGMKTAHGKERRQTNENIDKKSKYNHIHKCVKNGMEDQDRQTYRQIHNHHSFTLKTKESEEPL